MAANEDSKRREPLYPQLDADAEHVHFEMATLSGNSLLWLTLRRGITPERASVCLRKIADLIDRQGTSLLPLLEGRDEPLQLKYDENGDIAVGP